MSKHTDIVPLLAKHLDPHLAIKMLQFLREGGHRSSQQILAAEMRILDKTNLVDLMAELALKNKDSPSPAEIQKRRKSVHEELQRLTEICRPLLDVLVNEKKVQQMQEEKVLTNVELRDKHKVPSEALENLYRYCKCLFECGQYSDAHRHLQFVRVLGGITQAEDEGAMWGILAAAICGGADGAKLRGAFKTVREKIDQKAQIFIGTAGPRGRGLLQERAWLLHWSLFVFFDSEEGLDEMTDLMMQDAYMQVLQTAAPHLLRYFSVAVLLNTTPRKRQLLERLEQLLAQEQNYYSDPVTEFINAVTVRFDFDAASDRLAECETVIRGDFFLQRWLDDFMEMARLLVFKTYCLIHKNIEIKTLSMRLRMDEQQAERWIGRSIRAHRLDARIDSSNNTIVMGDVNESVYKIVLEKTRTLTVKTIGALGQVQRQGFSVNASKSYNPRQPGGGRAGPN